MSDENTCSYSKCKDKVEITYCGKPLCDKHWNKLCDKTPDEVKEILGVKKQKDKGSEGREL